MQIQNVSGTMLEIGDLNVTNGINGTSMHPGQILTIFDEDAEKSAGLKKMMAASKVIKVGDLEPGETVITDGLELANKISAWVLSQDAAFAFSSATYSGTHTAGAVITVKVVSGAGAIDTFNQVATIVVTPTGTHTPLINGAASATLTMVNGIATAVITDNAADSVTVALSGGNTSLTKTATATVTLS